MADLRFSCRRTLSRFSSSSFVVWPLVDDSVDSELLALARVDEVFEVPLFVVADDDVRLLRGSLLIEEVLALLAAAAEGREYLMYCKITEMIS